MVPYYIIFNKYTRLTVVKAIMKGKSPISAAKMKIFRKIPLNLDVDPNQICLGLKISDKKSTMMYYSEIIYDKATYNFDIDSIFVSWINDENDGKEEENLHKFQVGQNAFHLYLKNSNMKEGFKPKIELFDSNKDLILTSRKCKIYPPRSIILMFEIPIETTAQTGHILGPNHLLH